MNVEGLFLIELHVFEQISVKICNSVKKTLRSRKNCK